MKRGITLVALVVTIVILLILATVTISLLIGEKSVIAKARESSDKSELNDIADRMTMASSNIIMDATSKIITASQRADLDTIEGLLTKYNPIDKHLVTPASFKKDSTSNIYTFTYQPPESTWVLEYILNLELYNTTHSITEAN